MSLTLVQFILVCRPHCASHL